LHVLVYERVLRDNQPIQLAYTNRFFQIPDVRWQPNSNANADTYANADSNTDADTNSDTATNAKRAQ
jgi:hypothetical protein